jgi:hypothetical protein
MAAKNMTQKILDLAGEFVTKQQGDWDHAAWEGFVADMDKLGVPSTDEAKRNIGNIIEAAKYFYLLAPSPAVPGKPAAKPKAPAKSKAAVKPKSAAKPKAKKA